MPTNQDEQTPPDVPPVGQAFSGWKRCKNGVLVELLVPADARRASGPRREVRARFVDVVQVIGGDAGFSFTPMGTKPSLLVYSVGERVYAHQWRREWEGDNAATSRGGIHLFLTRAEAEAYVI